ncbi:LacI family DNA-binding transcriptional regulator [Halomonas sp. MCCC 1A17488]|uniref:LacI family DNA-binding transcriptional regulator n=1 Tax=Billgrantia sulfidoxydans TaxID=2733484 RepID=A0ABX7W9D3_9GAMM|nr:MULTISPECIES: LacI family DNA-binding transcriptional regulator [Halomonas]MCE8017657.1 LacI family DNA-binding transcriptional regulator [Halomonas sp. MCCC 1A17488]MCG3240990.1 LacI family DNA-binding transcriptional regulator [Halomonas sp. MCCC 1A17488]QPP48858.1 LacI family DNA-binding transcriptional regulator [Halomonas sp. SS10-MC5]QTP56187.1 LacI family DNA-binding transcriptional regulator [Halomonas sulfidoxydans]
MSKELQRTLLGDVAREAGVSTASVSRVLNNAPHVSARLRERVEAAIERLGYVPDGTARALASRRIGAIGALVPTLDNPIFGTMIDSLEHRLKRHDCRLLIATYRYDLDDEYQALRHLVQQGVDGVVVIGHDHRPEVRSLLQQRGLPFLSCWHAEDDPDWPCIGFDNAAPARRLANHLLMLGHRQFAVVTAPTEGNDRARARLKGFLQATEAAGHPLPPERIVTVPYGIAEGTQAYEELRRLPEPPTAILCGNDTLAFGVMLAAQRAGVSVPEQLSVTGYDDLPQARFMSPPLTTVAVPASEIGQRVADALTARISGEASPHRLLLDAPLVLRESTGPVPDFTS